MEATVNFVSTIAVSNFPAAPSDPSTGTKQDAAQTTLAAVLAKIVAAPALDATVTAGNALLTQIKALLPATLVGGRLDVNIGASGATVPVSGTVTTTGTSTVSGSVAVTNFPATQPVSIAVAPALVASSAVIGHVIADTGSTVAVTALPALPAGANAIGSVTVTSAPTTAVTIAALPALAAGSAVIGHVIADSGSTTAVTSLPSIPAGANAIGSVTVTSAPTTAITAAALPLPTGAATATNQSSIITSLGTLATQATLALMKTAIDTLVTNSPALINGRIPVAEGGSTTLGFTSIPVTGTQVKVGAGSIEYAHIYNGNSTNGIFMVFDLASTASLVSGTTKPIFQTSTITLSAPGNLAPTKPMNFTNGLIIAMSVTAGVFTTNTGSNPTVIYGHVTYK